MESITHHDHVDKEQLVNESNDLLGFSSLIDWWLFENKLKYVTSQHYHQVDTYENR